MLGRGSQTRSKILVKKKTSKGWIGVDLDGTLAYYDKWQGIDQIGEPIGPMVARVKRWLANGADVRIFTARVAEKSEVKRYAVIAFIYVWCLKHLGQVLPVTNCKDFDMVELWDDRCVQVVPNTDLTVAEWKGEV